MDEKTLRFEKSTFVKRKERFRKGENARCTSLLGNAVTEQYHEIRKIKEFSIPEKIFKVFVANRCLDYSTRVNKIQIPGYTLAQGLRLP